MIRNAFYSAAPVVVAAVVFSIIMIVNCIAQDHALHPVHTSSTDTSPASFHYDPAEAAEHLRVMCQITQNGINLNIHSAPETDLGCK